MNESRGSRSTEAFFGRRVGRPLGSLQAEAMTRVLKQLRLEPGDPAPGDLRTIFATRVADIRLEIGFGGGEHLLAETRAFPNTGFIGVEPFVNGMAKLTAAISKPPPSNLRLYDDDAARVLDWLPDRSLAGIDLFYPDPWPKKRHWKRRFVNPANLDRFARVMAPGGVFRVASDIDSYIDWTLLHCRAHGVFAWVARSADDWRLPYAGWEGTRYEAKAIREGRVPAYLTFMRV